MNKADFQKLTQEGIILLDGATGSNLTLAGMPKGVCTETWVLENPEALLSLQRAYAEAGSRIVYASTFGANRINFSRFGLEKRIREYNKRLVDLSRKAVGDKALIAGDLTTTGRMLEPQGDISYECLFEAYAEQIEALRDAGADLLVAETMLNVDETTVALDAAVAVCDLPMMCTLTLEADGSALYGGNAVEAMETLQELGAAAVGVNCSVGPDQLEAVVASMKRVAKVPVIAKPNAGIPFIDSVGHAVYSMNAEAFAGHMKVLIAAGAGIIGGCCGTTPEYIRMLAEKI